MDINKKPRLPQWDDPNVIWPPVMNPAINLKQRKDLINKMECEEKYKYKKMKNFEFPEYRTGDLIKFHYLHSLSEGKGNTFTGIVIGKWRSRGFKAAFMVVFHFYGEPVKMKIFENSPFLVHFEVWKRGTGNFRSKCHYVWENMEPHHRFDQPILRKKVLSRSGDLKKKKRSKMGGSTVIYDDKGLDEKVSGKS